MTVFVRLFYPYFVRHSDDGICKIIAPVFCLLVDNSASGNTILLANNLLFVISCHSCLKLSDTLWIGWL